MCLHALEALPRISSLMKEHLGPLVYLLVPAVVDNHLNSRNSSIYSAAMEALHALTLNLGRFLSSTKVRVHLCLNGELALTFNPV